MGKNEEIEKHYTVQETADILDVHINTVMRRIRNNELEYYRTNGETGRYRIPHSAVMEIKNKETEKHYTVQETADILRVHTNTVLRRIRNNELEYYRTNGETGRYRIPHSAVMELMKPHASENNNEDEIK